MYVIVRYRILAEKLHDPGYHCSAPELACDERGFTREFTTEGVARDFMTKLQAEDSPRRHVFEVALKWN